MAENNVSKESFVMYEEILEIAAIRNFGMLCEKASEYGVDINSLREQIKSLESKDKDPEKIVQILSPLAKFFSDHEIFSHRDDAYLVAHNIRDDQATCASRTIMFGMFLKNFGLNPEYGHISVQSNNKLLSSHAAPHLLVGDHEIEWDFTLAPIDDWQKQNGNCLINIMEKYDGQYDIPSRDDLLNQSQSEYVYSQGKFTKFRSVKGVMPHKVVFKSKMPTIDHHHFISNITNEEFFKQLSRKDQELMREYAINILSNEIKQNGASGFSYHLLANQYRQKAHYFAIDSETEPLVEIYSQSVDSFEQALRLDPYNYNYHRNFGVLLFDPKYLALLESDGKMENIKKALPHLRYFIENAPDDADNLGFKKWCQATVEKFAFVEEKLSPPDQNI